MQVLGPVPSLGHGHECLRAIGLDVAGSIAHPKDGEMRRFPSREPCISLPKRILAAGAGLYVYF
jgi:hypothetical protein